MKLKPSRLRKAKDQIVRVTEKTALLLLQNSSKEAFAKRENLSKSGVISETRDERLELQEHIKELERKKGILEARDTLFEKDHKEASRRVEEQKQLLEKIVSELSSNSVKILIN